MEQAGGGWVEKHYDDSTYHSFFDAKAAEAHKEREEAVKREDETFIPVGAPYKVMNTSLMLFQPALEMWKRADEMWHAKFVDKDTGEESSYTRAEMYEYYKDGEKK